ncbi:MAG: carboxymuconolactone decarboxylase family protein [Anaerolineae bacterium]
MSNLPRSYRQFKKEHARLWRAYDKLGAAAAESGPLDAKTRELIKLGMAAAQRSESAVKSHVHRALEAGASTDEVTHAVLLGVTTIGFPAMMTALNWAQEAINAQATQRD